MPRLATHSYPPFVNSRSISTAANRENERLSDTFLILLNPQMPCDHSDGHLFNNLTALVLLCSIIYNEVITVENGQFPLETHNLPLAPDIFEPAVEKKKGATPGNNPIIKSQSRICFIRSSSPPYLCWPSPEPWQRRVHWGRRADCH